MNTEKIKRKIKYIFSKKDQLKNKNFLSTAFDWNLVLTILLLNIFGVIMIYSASYFYAQTAYHKNPDYFFRSQVRNIIIGFVGFFVFSYLRPSFYRFFMLLPLLACFFFVFSVKIPGLGWASHGAYRWIKIKGITVQVAEPIKLCFIIAVASLITRFDIRKRTVVAVILGISVILSLLVYLITDNLSTAVILLGMVFLTITVMIPKPRGMYLLMAIGVIFAALAVYRIVNRIPYDPEEPFRYTRIRAWVDPENPEFLKNEAYQARQALYAIASGGFFGKGLGQSLLKFRLPEPHNDYILAVIFEELGVFGVLLLTMLFLYLLFRIFSIYMHAKDRFTQAMVLGVFFHIALQVLLNYAVTLGLAPTTGVTLPFISAGGSSVIFTLSELGLVSSAARQNTEDRLYRESLKEAEDRDAYLKKLNDEEKQLYNEKMKRKRQREEKLERRRKAEREQKRAEHIVYRK